MSKDKKLSPRLTALSQSLPSSVPFVAPEMTERLSGIPFVARLGANESSFGPSPKVRRVIAESCSEVFKYGDPDAFDLKLELEKQLKVPNQNIVVGEGIDGLMGILCRLMLEEGDVVVTSNGAYPTFNYQVKGVGGKLETVPYLNDYEDPKALIAKAKEQNAKMIYLANPDNPMGTYHTASIIQEMIDSVPDGSLLVLDEAYIELAPQGTAPKIDILNKNVIRLRTFSKAYGLAGARVGYAIGHMDLIKSFDKIRNHFGVNTIGQKAALAALKDQLYVAEVCRSISLGRERINQIAIENGLKTIPSSTNFVAVDCGKDGNFTRKVLAELVGMGIFVRMAFVAPQDRCLRVSIGIPEDIELFSKAFPLALENARKK
ncbi:pyridoxal phosphate-dependent aminotransferase [Amylibacter sp.]|nr:pyridoxal phosphate-dependent aminotransferase [Amylibacter sp.]MDC3303671.1 pyridoxal phosphate-dependent aminotransferase [Amylibacter sp.]